MKQAPVTIKDIAKALSLSPSTVARALKESYKISKETTQKVKEYAEKNGYRPNLIAQSLRNQNSRTIGVLLCSIPNSFFAEVINGIESIATSKNYYVIISQSHESYESEVKNLQHLESRQIDGLLVSLSAETKDISHFKELHDNGVPVVFFDRISDEFETFRVVSNSSKGAYDLTVHLIENGYKQIAHITSSQNISITSERLQGYEKALAEYGIPYTEEYVKYCEHGGRDAKEINDAIDELFALTNPPNAIVTASDRITLETLSSLTNRGFKIPDEIAIGGFSNFSSSHLFHPSLTTIVQPAFEMGRVATELLIKMIESKKPIKEFDKIVLPTQLIIRNSTARSQM
jgi:LacI family transcriptional regulator